MTFVAPLFLILSGIAALTYQVVWVRLLSFSIGSTSAAISTVIATFFFGMALGSFLAERISRNKIHSFTPYLWLELLIGVSGLALLPVLLHLDQTMVQFAELSSQLYFKFLVSFLLLSIPTICMGATFPVMAGILIRKNADIGVRIGQLYSFNTLGGVIGALGAGFVFIPSFGLDGAIYIAAALNLSIFFIGLWLNRSISLPAVETPVPESIALTEKRGVRFLALVVLFATGFTSIATEVGWTKYLSIFTGTTIYGFAAILGIFLIGIAAGSWAIKRRIETIKKPVLWLCFFLFATAAMLLITRAALSILPVIYEGVNNMSVENGTRQAIKYAFVLFTLLPATFLLGAIFPLNIRLYCGDLAGVRSRVGQAYAVNTIASILGSLAAGFWLIPRYGTDNTLTLMAVLLIVVAASFLLSAVNRAQRITILTIATATVSLHFLLPHISYEKLISSVQYVYDDDVAKRKKPEFLFLKEGKVSVISLVSYDARKAKVQANGLNESIIDMLDQSNALIIESFLAYMPYFLHPNPQSVFVVGFGGGITTRAFTYTDVKSIRVVELEPAVIEAGRAIPNGPIKALEDPRVTVDFNDARNTLLLENNQYDLISAQASHPWLAGASNVFTQEFFQLASNRLAPGGIYSQWVNMFQMDVTTLKSIFKAFYNVFPEGLSFADIDTGDLMLVGSAKPLTFDYEKIAAKMARPDIKQMLQRKKIAIPQDLLWYFSLSRQEMVNIAGDAIPNRDTNLLSEVRLSALSGSLAEDEDPFKLFTKTFSFDFAHYLPEQDNKKARLYNSALYFMEWQSPRAAIKIAAQLARIDEKWSRSLMHELYWWHQNPVRATEMYEENHDLLDSAHLSQIEIYMDQQQSEKAKLVIDNIENEKSKRVASAYLLYLQQQWRQLTLLSPLSNAEAKWQLLGLAQFNLVEAGKRLAPLIVNNSTEIPQIRVLIAYYGTINDIENMDKWTRRLAELNQKTIERYMIVAKTALEEKNTAWARRLITQIEKENPDDSHLIDLKLSVEKLERENASPAKTQTKTGI